MNTSIFRFSLDLHSLQSQMTIPAFHGDTSITLYITITDGGRPVILTPGSLAKITIKRPTGTFLEDFCMIRNNQTIIYPFAQNEGTCAVEGLNECDITLFSPEGYQVGTSRFAIMVAEKVMKRDEINIADEDYVIVAAMAKAEAERQIAEASRVEAETGRVEAEAGRVSAEEARAEVFSEYDERLKALEDGHTIDHRKLTDRDAEDAHPMSAISGLVEAIEFLEGAVAKLSDVPIVIKTFKSSHSVVELGSTVDVTLTWTLSEEAKAQTLDGVALDVHAREHMVEGVTMSAPGTKKWVLEVVGEYDEEVSGSVSVTFANGIYYGAAAAPEAYGSDFIQGLAYSTLRNSKLSSFNADAGEGEYLYYCLPVRLGTCVFSFGANEGGVSLVGTVLFENESGYSEEYYIYRSDESGLGNTTLGVK